MGQVLEAEGLADQEAAKRNGAEFELVHSHAIIWAVKETA